MQKLKTTIILSLVGVITLASTMLGTDLQATSSTPPFPLNADEEWGKDGNHYVPSSLENIEWGNIPNRNSEAVLQIISGDTVTFDTISAEGILEDQGRDPETYFGSFDVAPDGVLEDAKELAGSDTEHDFAEDGPHIVTGPVAIEGAEPGDVLKVEVLSLIPRVPYGVISNRHGKGALPGEFPENEGPQEGASTEQPELYNNVSVFTPIEKRGDQWYGEIPGEDVFFPIQPFVGMMGVATDTDEEIHSVPPTHTGGNIDINDLGEGSTLYLPIEVDGGLFYTGDPHFSQGDGEVALSALEGSLRATFRLTVLKQGDEAIPGDPMNFDHLFGETEDYWIPIGLNEDLDEAMKEATRHSIDFLSDQLGMDRANALAYLSASTDYEVSQVVDQTKGIHGMINKADFQDKLAANGEEAGERLPDTATSAPHLLLAGTLALVAGGMVLIVWKRRKQA
ncbi:acetamidase/formamidase family protein [Gracilibacillus phocaeensis]|uniref:acetamidase/formamidase family protein n=1 Tax=Gracilibacillus phocaeensis TaxID=2042304 RepID=UPI0013EEFB14|nr:acetamidase/formamidase family protein [Gracilibacillus phocaeensis]